MNDQLTRAIAIIKDSLDKCTRRGCEKVGPWNYYGWGDEDSLCDAHIDIAPLYPREEYRKLASVRDAIKFVKEVTGEDI